MAQWLQIHLFRYPAVTHRSQVYLGAFLLPSAVFWKCLHVILSCCWLINQSILPQARTDNEWIYLKKIHLKSCRWFLVYTIMSNNMTLLGSTKCKSLSNTENTANNPKSQQLSHYLLKKPDFFIFLLFMDQTVIIFYIYTKFIIFFLLHALLEEAFIVKQTTTLKENKWGTERAGEEL